MKNKLKLIVFLIGMLFLNINNIFAQITPAQVEVGVDFSDNTGANFNGVVAFGLDPLATDGYDGLPFEDALPPFSPGLEVRFVLGAVESYTDIRNAPAFPYSGVKTHNLRWQLNAGGNVLNLAYNFPTGVTAVVSTILGSSPVLTGTGTYQITNANIVTQGTLQVTYVNVGPAAPGPIFSVSPSSINFGNVGLGGSATTTLTVNNPGTTNSLSISSASILGAAPEFTVVPNPPATFPIVVAPGASYNFDVTFAPTVGGNFSDNVRFTHNAPGSPSDVAVTGVGQAQGGDLVFDPQTRTIFDNSQGYSTAIRLENYVGNALKALQFKIILDGKLVFRSIERGAAIANGANWTFAYQIAPGSVNSDGSRNDTIKVVILGNGTNQLPAGDHEIAIIEYDAVNVQVNQTTTTVHFEDVIGGTGTPNPGGDANIIAGPAQLITINNRVFYGDVNLDDRVDILDILLMIDYILERNTFSTEQFTRGDISPWTPGQPAPSPDGQINALDLALLQNIILTGLYPSNEPATRPIQLLDIAEKSFQKLNPGDDAALTFHITEQGIAVVLESIVKVKGLQVNFSEVNNSTAGMQVETVMGNGYYYQDQKIMRVLVYDEL
ncbi:MAG: choice-of-anchor D domain-containing protein, partial [Ignavibacteriaceae bacterium]|nr:choice-of-anchor D domain-containing protein [Ignavibacteriaceae bacterium]